MIEKLAQSYIIVRIYSTIKIIINCVFNPFYFKILFLYDSIHTYIGKILAI
ncbi:hypothetical protein BN1097_630178 [Clostridioides difficile]|uniref:Uncharacterized protein n=1 Tax=Clostridioides difficile TaxID=1496 RepID=A0A069AEB1_CLODI|nr:hypothetical protein BN1097_630178 [Clostridioides difficile]